MIGIRDVLDRYHKSHHNKPPLSFRLMQRHTFPMKHYDIESRSISGASQALKMTQLMRMEFQKWRNANTADFSVDSNDQLHWSYEIIECRMIKETLVTESPDV